MVDYLAFLYEGYPSQSQNFIELTSPKAPFPITLTVLKSPRPILVRRNRKKLRERNVISLDETSP